MKKEITSINATPNKRLFLSIIADYDLNRAICELVDNSLDVWVRNGKTQQIQVDIDIDCRQQFIRVSDNAGGVPKHELHNIVGPGQTSAVSTDQTIGIFGVGSKRAVVALSQDIKIKTRHGKDKTYQVDIADAWLKSDSWDIPAYEIDNIKENSTIIELQMLRMNIDASAIEHLKIHLCETYAHYLKESNICIRVNTHPLKAVFFTNWAYPPGFEPRRYFGDLQLDNGRTIKIEGLAGLILESSPAGGEYGVYFYCNDRLIVKGLKTYEVGFTKGLAGQPHPKVSITRVIVSLHGDAGSMPWNSSKSDISTNHQVFIALRNWLIKAVTDYAYLSRTWQGDWPDKVFQYKTGKIIDVPIDDFPTVKKSYLPDMPSSRPRFDDVVSGLNRKLTQNKPWAKGLYEGIIAVDYLSKQHLEQKNRISLIVLDSTLEIAFKEYLVNESGQYYTNQQLLHIFNSRHLVQTELSKYINIPASTWKKINYYYNLRCKLVHERITVSITDDQIEDYRSVVESLLNKLYKLKFK